MLFNVHYQITTKTEHYCVSKTHLSFPSPSTFHSSIDLMHFNRPFNCIPVDPYHNSTGSCINTFITDLSARNLNQLFAYFSRNRQVNLNLIVMSKALWHLGKCFSHVCGGRHQLQGLRNFYISFRGQQSLGSLGSSRK